MVCAAAVERQENPIFLRRMKEDMVGSDGKPLFPPRHARTIGYRLSPVEREVYDAVTRYVENYFQRAFQEESRNVQLALIVLQRRLGSSLRAIRKSLENRWERLKGIQRTGRRLLEHPAGVLRPEEELEVVRYVVRAEAWQRYARAVDAG